MNGKAALIVAGLVSLSSPNLATAQKDYTYGYAHVGEVEGDLTLQRATAADPDAATINYPVLPGDRAWTGLRSRAEILFTDGAAIHLDERTKVDFVDFAETTSETLLRHWSGSLILSVPEGATYRIDTPAGTAYSVAPGRFRVDVRDGGQSTILSVIEGVAELASPLGSVLVRGGQRSFIEASQRPEAPFAFNTAHLDDFGHWSDARSRYGAPTERVAGLPREVEVYGPDLHDYGVWSTHATYGPVWYPRVTVGWSPYHHGRWTFTRFGWTWVSYERWGWAPYHYGRWGYDPRGWYWIPGGYWGPAWVSWAIGPTWVGWCPLGYYDRPVIGFDTVFYRGGKAVPRSRFGFDDGWRVVHRRDFGSRAVERTRLSAADVHTTAHRATVLESGAILDRELEPRVVGAAAMTRTSARAVRRQDRDLSREGTAARAPRTLGRAGEVRGTERARPREGRGGGTDVQRAPERVNRAPGSEQAPSLPERTRRQGSSAETSRSTPAARPSDRLDRGRIIRSGEPATSGSSPRGVRTRGTTSSATDRVAPGPGPATRGSARQPPRATPRERAAPSRSLSPTERGRTSPAVRAPSRETREPRAPERPSVAPRERVTPRGNTGGTERGRTSPAVRAPSREAREPSAPERSRVAPRERATPRGRTNRTQSSRDSPSRAEPSREKPSVSSPGKDFFERTNRPSRPPRVERSTPSRSRPASRAEPRRSPSSNRPSSASSSSSTTRSREGSSGSTRARSRDRDHR